jgi:23S rRNA pseudouridine1911/1915/1917 synthase
MADSKINIIYQDEQIIVINKPSGISVTADRSGSVSLKEALKKQMPLEAAEEIRLIHRLDKDTSGVMILAKSKEAQTLFCGFFEERLVKKTYLALVTGRPTSTLREPQGQMSGTITANIAPKLKGGQLMCIDNKKGKSAVTDWRVLADFGGVLLLAVNPLTGRTHQIRVHLPSIGLNLVVDPLYGGGERLFLSDFKYHYKLGKGRIEKPLIDRLTLHAYQLEFAEPPLNTPAVFIAALDKNFAAAIKMLAKYNPKGPAAFLQSDTYQKILTASKL